MCKKLTKLVKDSEAMKEELAKYRSLYGDVDASLTVEEVRNTHTAHWTPLPHGVGRVKTKKDLQAATVMVSQL